MNPELSDLGRDMAKRVQAELRSGEVLHWVGRPGRVDASALSLGLLFAVTWMVLALMIAYGLYQETLVGWGIWGVMVPISLIAFIVVHRALRKARNTVYMITNHRVAWLVLHSREVRSLALTPCVVSGTVMRRGGRGDVVFTQSSDGLADDIFHNIADVRRVVALINDLSAGR